MANYRMIYSTFWTDDAKVVDDFTPEDKYFYLYILTNPHTNICGCYEVSTKAMARETGYNEETVKRLLDRMEHVHDVIRYCSSTKELLVLKWSRYNWTKSPKLLQSVVEVANYIKTEDFKDYVLNIANGGEIPYPYPMDTSVSVSESVSVSVSESVSVKEKPQKHKDGEYGHVLLTDDELTKLQNRFPNGKWLTKIREMDEAIERKGYKYKSHYLAILDWDRRDTEKRQKASGYNQFMDELRGAVNGE